MTSTKSLLRLFVGLSVLFGVWQWHQLFFASKIVYGNSEQPDAPVPSTTASGSHQLPVSRVTHETRYGLGHRLCRTSSAYHLAKSLNLTRMKFRWGTCGEDPKSGQEIFPFLFGADEWDVPSFSQSLSSQQPTHLGVNVLVRNDVYGYVPGQALKDVRKEIPTEFRREQGTFMTKLTSDIEFYQTLCDKYQFQDEVEEFKKKHRFDDHTVIGVHLRAGNGEEAHFEESGRGIINETAFVANMMELVNLLVEKEIRQQTFHSKPALIFLATDTAYLIPSIQELATSHGIGLVVLPQIRVDKSEGVTFKALKGAGDKCLDGWRSMFADMMILSHADILIAARHSSFTQSMPLSLVFHRFGKHPGPHFCEVSTLGTRMQCFQDLPSWFYRDQSELREVSYTLPNSNETVYHKLVVMVPDVEPSPDFMEAEDVLNGEEPRSWLLHTYGDKRFYAKYRGKRKMQSEWTFPLS